MMILIADSGSSKTDWAVTGGEGKVLRTQGLNPIHMNERQMSQILRAELLPQLGERASSIDTVFFYGAGVRSFRNRWPMLRLQKAVKWLLAPICWEQLGLCVVTRKALPASWERAPTRVFMTEVA